ncbi:hypothetical protein ACROYT_G025192 [Oculina patagonica]
MKPPWLCVLLILTSLGINSAAGNTNKEGVHVEEDTQGSYSIKIKVSRNVNRREVVVNIDLNAIKLENLSVNLKFDDTLNSKSSENTKPPHEEDRNETKDNDRNKNDGEPGIGGLKKDETNVNQTVAEDIALKDDVDRSKPDGDPSIVGFKKDETNDNQTVTENIALKGNRTIQHGDLQNKTYISNWFWKKWNIAYEGFINAFGCNELPKNINQHCFHWRSVTMSTTSHLFPGYDCEDPTKYITNGNKSSVSALSSQPVIRGDITQVKTDEDKEMHHVPFILRMPKDYKQYRLQGHIFTVNMDEVIDRSLTNKQNGNIFVESQRYQTKDNVSMEREATLFNKTMKHGDKQNKPKDRNKRKPDGDPSIVGLKEDETNDNQTVTEDIALLPGHNFTGDMNKIIPRNLTEKQNRNISVESHSYQTTDNVSMEREAMLTDKNFSMATINNASWLARKSPNVTRIENDGRILVEEVSGLNYLAHFYANPIRIAPTNSIWQEIFEIIVMYWMFDIGVMNLNCTACFIKGIIWLLRMLLERKLKKEQERLQKRRDGDRRKLM